MELKAKLIKVLTESGVSRNGNNWQKATAIVEWLDGQYTKMLALSNMSKAEELARLQTDVEYNWHFEATSREWNGRYFTEANTWRWEAVGGEQGTQVEQPQQNVAQPQYAPQPQVQQPQYAPQGQQQFNVPQQGYAPQQGGQNPDLPF